MATRQYIGARYVIKVYENSLDPNSAEWENVAFEPLTMVTYQNSSYLSKKQVSANVGNPVTATAYWVCTGYYNGQISALQTAVTAINTKIGDLDNLPTTDKDSIVDSIIELSSTIESLENNEVYVSAINYGIDNTGTETIDSTKIRTFLDAALTKNKIAYFPEGTYKFSNSFVINNTDRVHCHARAIFNFSESTDSDGVILNNGYYTNDIILGEVTGASDGAGIKFKCAETVNLKFKFISSCKYGILCDTRVGSNKRVSGNTITGNFITTCDYGLYFVGDSYEQEMQQNVFNIHLINTCTYGIYFSASTSVNWAYMTFNIATLFAEPSQTVSYGIIAEDAGNVNHMTFNIYQIYGGFKGVETLRLKGNDNILKLAILGVVTNPYEINVQGFSCYFENLYVGDGLDVPKAIKYPNTLGSWNEGKPLCGSNFDLDLPIDVALAVGDTKDLYFYHSFAFGSSDNIVFIPKWADAPMICTAIEDESIRYGVEGAGGIQRQIHIRLLALGAVATGDYRCRIKFNG